MTKRRPVPAAGTGRRCFWGSQKDLTVDLKTEFQLQGLGGPAAQEHPLEEDLKVVHDGAHLRVDGQGEGDGAAGHVQQHLRALHGVIHPVVDVESGHVLVADPAAAHIRFIGQDQGGGHGVHREGGGVIVVANGGDDCGHVGGLHPHLVQNAEGHGGAADGVVVAVDHVADVVHKGGDLGQLHLLGAVPQLSQDAGGHLGAFGHMGEGVLRKAQSGEGRVGLGDIGADLGGIFDDLKGDVHSEAPFFLLPSGPKTAGQIDAAIR